MDNLKHTLEAACSTLDDIVKTTVYITNLDYSEAVSDVRQEYFRDKYPASIILVVSKLYREDILVENDAIAVLE
jgi:2-iminobutanoate/2-iminopropanoate deaminase